MTELIEKNALLEKADAEIKGLNSELKRHLEQVEQANQELESFSYSISHDLRAPLRILNANASIMLEDYEDRFDADGKQVIGNIVRNVNKMNSLIDELLKLSKMGRQKIQESEIDMGKLVQEAILEVNGPNPEKVGIEVNSLLPAFADYSLLAQVWIKLISNAIKYSSKKENPVVSIGCRKEENEIIYYVKDNGAGFNMKYADRLFGAFQRMHNTTDFEGTGISLSIVKRIIGRHNGRVWAEGKVDEGATFYFTLPG